MSSEGHELPNLCSMSKQSIRFASESSQMHSSRNFKVPCLPTREGSTGFRSRLTTETSFSGLHFKKLYHSVAWFRLCKLLPFLGFWELYPIHSWNLIGVSLCLKKKRGLKPQNTFRAILGNSGQYWECLKSFTKLHCPISTTNTKNKHKGSRFMPPSPIKQTSDCKATELYELHDDDWSHSHYSTIMIGSNFHQPRTGSITR